MQVRRIGSLILIIAMLALSAVPACAEGDGSAAEQFIASVGFATTQGENNWYYRARNCAGGAVSELNKTAASDDTTVWRQNSGNDRGYISKDTTLPGVNEKTVYDTLRVFRAPKSGTVVIGANGTIGAKDAGIDNPFGVQIRIMKNGEKLYPIDSDWEELTERSQSITLEPILTAVEAEDEISFEAHRTLNLSPAEMRQNILKWDPMLTYLKMEGVKVGGYTAGMEPELTGGLSISEEDEFYLSEAGSGKAMFGDHTLENCGISAMVSGTDTEGGILLYANDSGAGGYAVRFTRAGVALWKNGQTIASAADTLSDGKTVLLETARVAGDAVFVSVKLDGVAALTYLDEDGCAPGRLGIGAENAAVRFGEVAFYASTAQYADLTPVRAAVAACEQLKTEVSIEALTAAASAVRNAENPCAAYVLDAAIQEILSASGYRYIDAEAETESRTLRVKGLAYDLRNSEVSVTVSDATGRILAFPVTADGNGVLAGAVTLPDSVGSGELTVASEEHNLRTTVSYRAASAQCDLLSFRLDGVSGVIGTDTVAVTLTARTDLRHMIALFTASDYAEVSVNGVKQESGTTANDFSSAVVYTVKAENGTEKRYTITVTYQPESGGTVDIGGGFSGGGFGGGGLGGGFSGGTGVKKEVAVDKTIYANPAEEDTERTDGADGAARIYADVDSARWSYAYIKALTDKQIICGNRQGLFEPERSITRAEFIKMMVLALGLEEADTDAEFDDVRAEDWYSGYVKTACAQGLAEGYDGHFGADDPITREDMCVILYRASEGLPKTQDGIAFDDAEEISAYARESVAALCAAGIVSGEDGRFHPKASATREQAAKLVASIFG